MEKKAELTTQQIVMIIILVASFSVLLIFLYNILKDDITDKQICHDSVLKKAQGGILNNGILNCKTNYVCISGGGDCEKFVETVTREVDLNGDVKKQVTKIIADEMVDCWWMFGEGKLDYFEDTDGIHCGICAKIKFDESVIQKLNGFSFNEFYTRLGEETDDIQRDYSAYLYGKKNFNFQEIDSRYNLSDSFFNSDESYLIVTGRDGAGLWGAEFYGVHFIETLLIQTSEIDKLECDSFDLTKA